MAPKKFIFSLGAGDVGQRCLGHHRVRDECEAIGLLGLLFKVKGPDSAFMDHGRRADGRGIVLVAELMGHARLETTLRYTKPCEIDRQNAINTLPAVR